MNFTSILELTCHIKDADYIFPFANNFVFYPFFLTNYMRYFKDPGNIERDYVFMITKLNEGESYVGQDNGYEAISYEQDGYMESNEAGENAYYDGGSDPSLTQGYAKTDNGYADEDESLEYVDAGETSEYEDEAAEETSEDGYSEDIEEMEDSDEDDDTTEVKRSRASRRREKRSAKRKKNARAKKDAFRVSRGSLGFFPEILFILRDGLSLKGRTQRREFMFGFFPIFLLANSLLLFITTRITSDIASFLITAAGSILLLVWGVPVFIRRLHDAGRDNKYIVFFAGLLFVAPLYVIFALFTVKDSSIVFCVLFMVGVLIVAILALLIPILLFVSEVGDNEWGPDPMDEANDKYADYGMIPQLLVFAAALGLSAFLIYNSTPQNVLRDAEKYIGGDQFDYYGDMEIDSQYLLNDVVEDASEGLQ